MSCSRSPASLGGQVPNIGSIFLEAWRRAMPASKHTKKVIGRPKLARQWQHVEDSMKARGASPGASVRAANAVVKRASRAKRK